MNPAPSSARRNVGSSVRLNAGSFVRFSKSAMTTATGFVRAGLRLRPRSSTTRPTDKDDDGGHDRGDTRQAERCA